MHCTRVQNVSARVVCVHASMRVPATCKRASVLCACVRDCALVRACVRRACVNMCKYMHRERECAGVRVGVVCLSRMPVRMPIT